MVKSQKVNYYHVWNCVNLSLFFFGWYFILDSMNTSNLLQAWIGVFVVIIISISIYYQNKLERDLI